MLGLGLTGIWVSGKKMEASSGGSPEFMMYFSHFCLVFRVELL